MLPGIAIAMLLQASGPGTADTARVFAAGVVSVGNVFRGSFSPDGRTFFFFKKTTPGTEDYRIYSSRLVGDRWSQPEVVDLGGAYSDLYPAVSPDGRWLVFSSYRPIPGDTSTHPNAHIWAAERRGDGWGAPVFMSEASRIGHYHSGLMFTGDGWLQFTRSTPDFQNQLRLRARWTGRRLSTPSPQEEASRWNDWRRDRRVADARRTPDGRALILEVVPVDTLTGRNGPADLWVSERREGGWTEPRPLGARVNSSGMENFVFFSPDGRDLFFVRNFEEVVHVPLAAALAAPPDSPRAPRRLRRLTGFSVPESARRDGHQDLIFVSNIVGDGHVKDNNGFISRLSPNGAIDSFRFIAGGARGVTLHAPKGMAIRGDTLWVTDIDAVRAFHTRTGAALASIDLSALGALFLNDLAIAPDGVVYITDSGFRFDSLGRGRHVGPDRIFRVAAGRASIALETPRLNRPNGITWDAGRRRFLLAPLGDSTIVAWTPGDSTLTPVATGPGSYDGIEATVNGFLVSSLNGSVSRLHEGVIRPLIEGIRTPADIGWEPLRARLYIPQLGENTLEIWEIP